MITRFTKTARSLGWTGGENITLGKMLATGALIWGIYSIFHLLVNGIILDQSILPAQIITGAVPYPAGHPHEVFYPNAFSLQNYLAAALYAICPNPLFISAIRNLLFLFLSTFVAFSLTLLLTRKPLWGHLASVLTLSETVVRFQGVYPLRVFPVGYTDGHISIHLAILCVVLLLGRSWKMGGFFIGILPSVHAAFATLIWPWSLCFLLFSKNRPHGTDVHRLLKGTCAGVIISIALAIVISFSSTEQRIAKYPYDAHENGEIIRQNFISTTDSHRQFFTPHSLAYFANPIIFFVICIMLLYRTNQSKIDSSQIPENSYFFWIIFLGGFTWFIVYGTWFYQLVKGSLPVYLDIIMPYRFSNITALLLIPLTLTGIAYVQRDTTESLRFLISTILIGLVIIIGIRIINDQRFLMRNLIVFFWGMLFALNLVSTRYRSKFSLLNLLFTLVISVILLSLSARTDNYKTLAGILFVISFIVFSAILVLAGRLSEYFRFPWHRWNSWANYVLLFLCLSISIVTNLGDPFLNRKHAVYDKAGIRLGRWYQINQHDRNLKKWLMTNTQPNEMILLHVAHRFGLQAKTSHPVLFEIRTLWLMTYMPSLAPVIGSMMRDIYGINYIDLNQLMQISDNNSFRLLMSSLETWAERSLEEWQDLKSKYNFRLVLSPAGTSLNLPAVFMSPIWTLYSIP